VNRAAFPSGTFTIREKELDYPFMETEEGKREEEANNRPPATFAFGKTPTRT
jgi:hypothetical protein